MRVAVVGHVEWVLFAEVGAIPKPGEIVSARAWWEEPAGGGSVAAVGLARLAGDCTFYTALGDDGYGRRAHDELGRLGVRVEATFRDEPQRRGFTYLDEKHERTITLLGPKIHPHGADPLAWSEFDGVDAVYLCAGDPDAVRAARRARVLVATARELPRLREARVELDALVASDEDPAERYRPGDLDPPPRLVVRTSGAAGGTYEPGRGSWPPAQVPGPVHDAYGAGDSFAAGLAYALGADFSPDEAVRFAARAGAEALTRRGAHGR
jgi:ribokinase